MILIKSNLNENITSLYDVHVDRNLMIAVELYNI